MTKYTAEDFARAEFARREDGRIAARTDPHSVYPWVGGNGWWSTDAEMAADPGWSIVRHADTLTAREYLDAAWEEAHVVDVIPAGAAFIIRHAEGSCYTLPKGLPSDLLARSDGVERRLLDPPPAPAWHTARIIEATLKGGRTPTRWARTDIGTWLCLSGNELGEEHGSGALRDVTVIVGADNANEQDPR